MNMLLYPFLLGIYFVLFIFSENLGEVYLEQTLRSLIAVLIGTAIVLMLLAAVFHSVNKAGFITALLLTIVFISVGLYELIANEIDISSTIFLLLEITALAILTFITLRATRDWVKLNRTLNLMACVLLG